MALARSMASRLLQQNQRHAGRLLAPSSHGILSRFSSSDAAAAKEVAVETADSKKRRLRSWLPRRFLRRRNAPRDIVPSVNDMLQGGLGNALWEATNNINRLFENLTPPSGLVGQLREKDDAYKLRYEVPGLAKEDLKITIRDGVLNIVGERKEEEGGDESDDEFWSAKSYGLYNSSIVLPEDAKQDDVKAELKDGVLTVVIPKDEKKAKQVKEVQIH